MIKNKIESEGYEIKVVSAYTGVNYERAKEFSAQIEEQYGVAIHFPIEGIGRHRHDVKIFEVPKRDIDLLDDVLDILNENRYKIEGIGRLLKRGCGVPAN